MINRENYRHSDMEDIKLHEDIACLKVEYRNLKEDINKIMNNHLPHIQAKVDKLFWLVLTTAIGVAVEAIVYILSKL